MIESEALEGLTPYSSYLRKDMIYRASQLDTLFPIDESYVFPKNAMLHIMSNMSSGDNVIDGIHMEKYPVLFDRNTIRFIKHMTDFNILGTAYRKEFPG